MSKELDALADLARAGKKFLEALKPDEGVEPVKEEPVRPEPPADSWRVAVTQPVPGCTHAHAGEYVIPKPYVDKVFEMLDTPGVTSIMPAGVLQRLEILRTRVGRGRT